MELLVALLSLVFLLTGGLLRFRARAHRTEFGKSIRWYDVRFWFAPWRINDILTERGVKLHTTSTALLVAGAALYLIMERLPGAM